MKIKFNHEIEYDQNEYESLVGTVSNALTGLIGIGSMLVQGRLNEVKSEHIHNCEMDKLKTIHAQNLEASNSEQERYFDKVRFEQEQKLEALKAEHDRHMEKQQVLFDQEQERINQAVNSTFSWKPEVEEENH
jgi:hypothetical protein